jgi:hypothetical protein
LAKAAYQLRSKIGRHTAHNITRQAGILLVGKLALSPIHGIVSRTA